MQENGDTSFQEEVETFVNGITEHSIPATKQRLEVYRIAQEGDLVCSQIMKYCHEGWPKKNELTPERAPFWKAKNFMINFCSIEAES